MKKIILALGIVLTSQSSFANGLTASQQEALELMNQGTCSVSEYYYAYDRRLKSEDIKPLNTWELKSDAQNIVLWPSGKIELKDAKRIVYVSLSKLSNGRAYFEMEIIGQSLYRPFYTEAMASTSSEQVSGVNFRVANEAAFRNYSLNCK